MNVISRYDREELFKLIQAKLWREVIELFKNNKIYKQIREDPIANRILEDVFIKELILGKSFSSESNHVHYLEQFYLLHMTPGFDFKLDKDDFEKLVVKLATEYYEAERLKEAYQYAKNLPSHFFCKQVIEEFKRTQPVNVKHSQSDYIHLTETQGESEIDHTISLFKSEQEYLFFRALREAFPMYVVFPNIALSSIINFEAIQGLLQQKERSFFFRSLIDCVVLDQEEFYKPKYFFELDSIFHDSDKQIENDKMKDNIIRLAGHKLYRIRSRGKIISEKDFSILIRDTVN
ncbi:Protein of unknown function [Catalinimonas alkaloidigena]|uniref:DUF2726 domain-containing protein n=1 Tax=Catalinimonas alkaloidigena TaxID=1075417 RepID=A0A1G9BW71_9BACT|nr:DUF2726 domain-containing protein [Catalinimonas alkaloidigena]SDK43414.1 Protein of unknown function [Catalinimonas alkaloidigena]